MGRNIIERKATQAGNINPPTNGYKNDKCRISLWSKS